jgi:hypothetical protein
MANPLGGMFARPEEKRGPLAGFRDNVAMVGGVIAGVTPPRIAEREAMNEQRQKAMATDAMTVYQLVNDNKIEDAISLTNRRISYIEQLGGDPSDTIQIRDLLSNPETLDIARQELGLFVQASMENGLLPAPRVPEQFTLGADEVRYDDQGRVIARGIPKPVEARQEPAQSEIAKINRDVANGYITPEEGESLKAMLNKPEVPSEEDIVRLELARTQLGTAQQNATQSATETSQRQGMIQNELVRAYELADKLVNSADAVKGVTGPIQGRLPVLFGQDRAAARADLEELGNLLTMANLGRMTGVLSESDIRLIASASSGLSATGSDARTIEKLAEIRDRIKNNPMVAGILSGNAAPQASGGMTVGGYIVEEVAQ